MTWRPIVLKNVRVHNLKGIDLTLPPGQLIVFTGVSGSGKSSLAFDTIYAEGQRRYIDALPHASRRFLGELPKPAADLIEGISPTIAIEQKWAGHHPRSTVGTLTSIYDALRVLYARVGIPHCPISKEAVRTQSREQILATLHHLPEGSSLFILAPFIRGQKGACKEELAELLRRGFVRLRIDQEWVNLDTLDRLAPDTAHDIDIIVDRLELRDTTRFRLKESASFALEIGKGLFSLYFPTTKEERLFSQCAYAPTSKLSYGPLEPQDFSFNHPHGMCSTCRGLGVTALRQPCADCHGSRLKPYPSETQFEGKKIFELTQLSLSELDTFFRMIHLSSHDAQIAEEPLQEIRKKLSFLIDMGLAYLTLDRSTASLSGGEAQRVRLASQLGLPFTGATYVLDEPSIGLHPIDHHRFIRSLRSLVEHGNTVIVVEHDANTMRAADYLVDMGPGAGEEGGEIVGQGSFEELLACTRSKTAAYLSGRLSVLPPLKKRTPGPKTIELIGATHHNLQYVTLSLPLQCLICVTGVSGSGKSSLISDTLYPALARHLHQAQEPVGSYQQLTGVEAIDAIIAVDQSPIGRTSRSNAATYITLFDDIRTLFQELPESQIRGFTASHFSFNLQEGACHTCRGLGHITIDLDFLEDAISPCPQCKGKQFEPEVLTVTYRDHSIADVLRLSVKEATEIFKAVPSICKKLKMLSAVGLDYLKLGQPSTTLSGGEAQRIKLAKELIRPATAHTLYLFDEPTTGLHFEEVHRLVTIFQELVERGHTVLVIEHNLDLIQAADWIIDLGPGAGPQGGRIVGEGPPETIRRLSTATGQALQGIQEPLRTIKTSPPTPAPIQIQGACQNYLKEISLSLPQEALIVFTGPSGSGKSSLALETLYAEGQRRFVDTLPPYCRQSITPLPHAKVQAIHNLPPTLALEQKTGGLNPRSTVGTLTETYDLLRLFYAHLGQAYCPESGAPIREMSKEAAVKRLLAELPGQKVTLLAPLALHKRETFPDLLARVSRLGFLRIRLNQVFYEIDAEIPYEALRQNELYLVIDRLVIHPSQTDRLHNSITQALQWAPPTFLIATDHEDLFFNLSFSVEKTGKSYPPLTPKTFSFNSIEGMCLQCHGLGCSACKDTRINPLARHVQLNNVTLPTLVAQPLMELPAWLLKLALPPFLIESHAQLLRSLTLLIDMGLGYLSLNRSAPSLSGGELQRVRLTRQLSGGLTSCLYIFDEPSRGLHPSQIPQLLTALKTLQKKGNTLLLIEHHPAMIQAADLMIDFGPGSGRCGGEIVAQGTPAPGIQQHAPIGHRHSVPTSHIEIHNASLHNLRSLNLTLPMGAMSCLTGVSGSGKSTLLRALLKPAAEEAIRTKSQEIQYLGTTFRNLHLFKQLVTVDQTPLSQTTRSDVNTYTEIQTFIRTLLAETPPAKAKGLTPSHFSPNHPQGMCKTCQGLGHITVDMHFLSPVTLLCDSCQGHRLNSISRAITYRGKQFGEILRMTLQECHDFFQNIPNIRRRLDLLVEMGLPYLQLGQEISTLSNGEAQRLRLFRELVKRPKRPTLYLIDEPTVGLHHTELPPLFRILRRLIDQGHTVICVEHNLDLIQQADFLIDLGPDAGPFGGQIVASGTPEEVATVTTSRTGQALRMSYV